MRGESFLEIFQKQADRKKRYRDYFLVYTIIFAAVSFCVFFAYIVNGKSFIWESDGFTQHYPALLYYGRWLRTILKGILLEHKFVFPEWNFSIGYGADIITTLNYYCIGDPLTLLSAFVPERYTECLYDALCIIRLYLAGMAFSCFCFRMKKGRLATMAGAFSYIFCAFALFSAIRHPYFINPMIYLPLLLVGVERIFHKEKPTLFIFMVFISAVSNFYFFYMLVFAVVFYVVVRYFMFPHKNRWREMLPWILKFGGYGLLGTIMSAVILLPVVLMFLGGLRSAADLTHPILYPFRYYIGMITKLLTSKGLGSWTYLGITAPGLLSIILLFSRRKKDTALKVPFCLLTLFLLIPSFGSMLNGFNYVSNRWVWIYVALCSYILVSVWPDFFSMKKKQITFIAAGSGCYLILLFILGKWAGGVPENTFGGISLLLAVWAVLLMGSYLGKKSMYRIVPLCMFGIVLLHICMNAYYYYDEKEGNYISQFKESGKTYTEKGSTYTKAVLDAMGQDDSFGRYESSSYDRKGRNADMLMQTYGTQFYWSLMSGDIAQYCLLDMALNEGHSYSTRGNNQRTFLDAIASVKYFVAPSDYSGAIPYGYEALTGKNHGDSNEYIVYKNRYALPLGYTYSSYISREDYERITAPERQEALLQGVVLEDEAIAELPEEITDETLSYSEESIEYKLSCGKNVVQQKDGSFIVDEAEAKVTLNFKGMEDCETYLYVAGVDVVCDDSYATNWDNAEFKILVESGSIHSAFSYKTSYEKHYIGQDAFLVNLGYKQEASSSITMVFPQKGIYHFKDMKVICQPMDDYVKQIALRKEDVLENEEIETDMVSGTVALDRDKLLFLSIPYNKGWTAYVDGEETELLQANGMYMAVPLKAGKHTVRFVYHTYGLRAGFYISMIGFVAFGGVILFCRRQKRNET